VEPTHTERATQADAVAFTPGRAQRVGEEHFRLLVEGVRDYAILLLDPHGRVMSWNAGAERIKGYTAEEIVGQHFSRFYPKDAVEKGWPERELKMAREEGRFEDEGWRVRKDGSQFWANVVVTALRDEAGEIRGFLKITRDLTARRQAEEKFRGLLESAPDAMVIVDQRGHIVLVNSQTERLFGYGREELIGQPIEMLAPDHVRARHGHHPDGDFTGPDRQPMGTGHELFGVRKDGSRFPVEMSLSPLQTPEGVLVSSAIRDITERKRAQERLEVFAEQLQRSNRELEQFASVAAHDLQEPLRKIEAFGDRLRSKCGDQLGDQGRDYLQRMQASAARMRRLINDLLAFSRVTTKARPFEQVALGRIVQEVLSDLEGTLQQTGGRVEVGELPAVEADPLQMRQLFQNLIGNALKFHGPGEPPIVEVTGRVVHQSGRARTCEISVQDHGIGFEEQYLDRIFQVFQRLHGRQEYEGTGMGLAICRKIVDRHFGTITARSRPGRGATFIVALPITQSEGGAQRGETTDAHDDPDGGR
jgi:two-component system sensor kinase FixL